MSDERLLTISQAAKRLGIHPTTLRTYADKGLIPMVRLPSGYRRFRPQDVDAFKQRMEGGDEQHAG